MLDLRAEDQKRYEEFAKGRASRSPVSDPSAPAANGHANRPLQSTDGTSAAAAVARLRQATDLMGFLGFDNLTSHREEIKVFCLAGCCYHEGARSARQVVEMLASPPPCLATDDLALRVAARLKATPRQAKAITVPLSRLAKVLSDHLGAKVSLVAYAGEGFSFDGLTETGELFWRLVADYLQKYLQ